VAKIALIGAGSVNFCAELLAGIFRFEALRESNLALHDVDGERLQTAEAIAHRMAEALGARPRIEAQSDRRAALDGADYVISMIRVGGHAGLRKDFEIPARHGMRQCMADTLGVGAIFRGLCTIPALTAVARDLADVSPDAWLLNYSNPMAMLCWAVYEGTPMKNIVGLCPSIDNTAEQLAGILGIPFDEVTYRGAGMNHQAWILRFEREGMDLYPQLRDVIERDPNGLGRRARVEAFRRLGYFPSESSEHFADTVPWFLPHSEMVERFRLPVNEYLDRSAHGLAEYEETRRALAAGAPIEVPDWMEYAPLIIDSIETGTRRLVYGNVRNDNLVDNLPPGSCVEVPCLVDDAGISPVRVGALPPQLAALNRVFASVAGLTVQAALEGDRRLVENAAMIDPNTAACLAPDEIRAVCAELIEAHAADLPGGITRGAGGA
jgi:alpha-galactosidase